MLMPNSVSVNQLLDVWTQLEKAYYEVSTYKSTVAEIYAFSVMPHSMTYQVHGFQNETDKFNSDALASIVDICYLFKERHADAKFEFESLGSLDEVLEMLTAGPIEVGHRFHIQVTKQ